MINKARSVCSGIPVTVGEDSECWVWRGRFDRTGYGRIDRNNTSFPVHRWVYMKLFGYVPRDLVVMHTCNNRACCNPLHLQVGTQNENNKYTAACDRTNKPKGMRNPNRVLDEEAVLTIRSSRLPVATLAKQFGVCLSAVYRAKKGTTWQM